MGRAFIAIFKNSACQNGIFAICSLRMLPRHYKRKLQYLQTVQIYHKELPRLSGIIRVHSGRTERTSPITSERFSPQKPMQAHFPAGAAAAAAHSRPIKNCLPFLCEAIARTADRLPNPSCPSRNVQGFLYSRQCRFPPPFHDTACFLFAHFSVKHKQSQGRNVALPPAPPHIKTAPASCYGNRGGSFALFVLFQALTQNLAGGLDRSLSSGQGVHSNNVFFFYHDVFS